MHIRVQLRDESWHELPAPATFLTWEAKRQHRWLNAITMGEWMRWLTVAEWLAETQDFVIA